MNEQSRGFRQLGERIWRWSQRRHRAVTLLVIAVRRIMDMNLPPRRQGDVSVAESLI